MGFLQATRASMIVLRPSDLIRSRTGRRTFIMRTIFMVPPPKYLSTTDPPDISTSASMSTNRSILFWSTCRKQYQPYQAGSQGYECNMVRHKGSSCRACVCLRAPADRASAFARVTLCGAKTCQQEREKNKGDGKLRE